MKYKFSELVDLDTLQNLMNEFHKLTGITNAVLDNDAKIIIASGFQQICSDFHRINSQTACRCQDSDKDASIRTGNGYIIYQCKNGLMDGATPIIVNGEHLATIFAGQWFESEPDEEYFRRQALEYGFDVEKYVASLRKVPVISRSKIEISMRFLVQLAVILSNLGIKHLEQKKNEESLRILNENLKNLVSERTAKLDIANANLLRDQTERKQLEREIIRLDGLNLVGEMAASLAHEIRNPMTTIRGFLQFFMYNQDFIEYQENIELMIQEIDRANGIIAEYLSLAKNKALNLNINNLNTVLNAVSPLISFYAIKKEINVMLLQGDIKDCLLDDKEVRQLILNLVRNGIEAMPKGGNLTIRTFMDREEIVLAVQDEGAGMTPETLEKLGTPFFTTKEEGTGLGLAVCFSIAARHNANIKVETGANGTTFFVYFK